MARQPASSMEVTGESHDLAKAWVNKNWKGPRKQPELKQPEIRPQRHAPIACPLLLGSLREASGRHVKPP